MFSFKKIRISWLKPTFEVAVVIFDPSGTEQSCLSKDFTGTHKTGKWRLKDFVDLLTASMILFLRSNFVVSEAPKVFDLLNYS